MKTENNKNNQGIIITGGALNANDVAVGENAYINKSSSINENNKDSINELRKEITNLINLMEQSELNEEYISSVKLAKTEINKDSPNIFLVKSIMLSIIDTIKDIGIFAGSIVSIQKLLGL